MARTEGRDGKTPQTRRKTNKSPDERPVLTLEQVYALADLAVQPASRESGEGQSEDVEGTA